MDFSKLRTFVNVVESGSFQKAAAKEYISQRAVSQNMFKLENELGFSLFIRGKNRISITKQGEEFYLKIRDMLHSFDVEVNSLKHQQKEKYSEVKVGYFSPFEGSLLKQQLFDYNQIAKRYHFVVSEQSIENLISNVSLGLLDFAYILDYGLQNFLANNLTSMTMFQSEMIMGVSRLNHISKLDKFPNEELKKKPILYFSLENSKYIKRCFLETLPQNLKDLHIARVSSIEQMQMIVALDDAFAYYPKDLIDLTWKSESQIHFMPLETKNENQNYSIQAIYQKDSARKGKVERLLQTLKS